MMHDRYCPVCGRRVEKESCCWYVEDDEDEPRPCLLMPAKPWEEWSPEHRFLIALMMERWGGAAEEWELLRRLPWPERRLVSCVCEPWGPWPVSARDYPCIRERNRRRTRYFLSDLARDAYTAHQRQLREDRRPMPGTWEGGPKHLSLNSQE